MSMKTDVKKRTLAAVAAASLAFGGIATTGTMASASDSPAQPSIAQQAVENQVTVTTRYMTSTDKYGTKIFTKKNAVANAKGVVVIVHGAAEHQGRYDYITKRLNDAGYTVYRLDHRGHGRSAAPYVKNAVPRAHIDNWHSLIADVHQLVGIAKSENPGKKSFLIGHSMGAMAVQSYGIEYPGDVDGIVSNGGGIFMNPWGKSTQYPQTIVADNLTEAERNAKPAKTENIPLPALTSYQSKLLPKVLKNRRNFTAPSVTAASRTIHIKNPFSGGVCTDQAVVDDYVADPLNNKDLTAGMIEQMGVAQVYNSINAHDFKTPTLIMHGQSDGLVPPYYDVNWQNAISSNDKTAYVWSGLMHEVFNEPVKDQPIDMVIDWIDNHDK